MKPELFSQIQRLGQGDHVCLIYDAADEQLVTAATFITVGLERDERCVYIADDRTTVEVIDALGAAGVEVGRRLESRSLEVLTKRDAYLRAGYFDPATMIAFLREATEEALRDGFRGLRVTGEMTWALGAERGCERLIEYEALLNRFLPGQRVLALCQYNRERSHPAVIRDVLRTHPIVVFDEEVYRENRFYEPPELVLRDLSETERVDWMLHQFHRPVSADERTRALHMARLACWRLDPATGAILWSNEAAALFGLDPPALGDSAGAFLALVHPDDREYVRQLLDLACRDRGSCVIDCRLDLPDGTERLVHLQAETVVDATAPAGRLDGIIQDVTDWIQDGPSRTRLHALAEAVAAGRGPADPH